MEKAVKNILWLSIAGTLFSGYLSATKLFSSSCAFNEPCPSFFGYPACYVGFLLFLSLFITSLCGVLRKRESSKIKTLLILSTIGTLFSGYYVLDELLNWLNAGEIQLYTLGLSTCMYGFVFFLLVFIISYNNFKKR